LHTSRGISKRGFYRDQVPWRDERTVRGVQLEGVSKRYGFREPWVVKDVSATASPGQLIRLEGPNGSGKSTLLRMVAGISVPTAGRVSGRPHTGYVPERFPGGLGFSARDYVTHLARIHGLRGASALAAAEEWLGRLGAADYADAQLRTLSKGMCQKVAIAQALVSRPPLLVLDEAWTGLDQAARRTLDDAVAERLADGGTVLYVDHHQARLAGQVSQRWVLGGHQVRVLAGPGPIARDHENDAGLTATIEVMGVDSESLPQLAHLPGVRLAEPVTPESVDGQGRVRVTVTAAASDAVLRELLSWDDVHVVSVTGDGRDGQ
jgi:ABC-2 type transport system ATP-binding protein